MKINISEILSNPSVIKNFKVEPDLFGREIHDLTVGIIGTGRLFF
mgnify:CR=1 FL=1